MSAAGTFESILLGPNEVYRPLVPKKLLAIYRRGACFGESELLHGTRRTSTVVCNAVGMVACISRREYLVREMVVLRHSNHCGHFLASRSASFHGVAVFSRGLNIEEVGHIFWVLEMYFLGI